MKNNFYLKDNYSYIYEKPHHKYKISSEIIYGEKFKILSKNKKWLKIKVSFDNYIGYIKNSRYTSSFKPTHKVFRIKSKIFKKPSSSKNHETKQYLTFGSKISIISTKNKFIEIEKNKWIKKDHVKKINTINKNYLEILNLFLNIKYVWGGKSFKGLDCSAILQLFYYYNNKFYPRDTKDQIRYSKKIVRINKFQKGDILFWKGHVAICINSRQLIHAYGPKKKVLIMPINYTIKKIKDTANLSIKKYSTIKF